MKENTILKESDGVGVRDIDSHINHPDNNAQ